MDAKRFHVDLDWIAEFDKEIEEMLKDPKFIDEMERHAREIHWFDIRELDKEWQEAEKEASEDIKQGRMSPIFSSAEESIRYLRKCLKTS